MSRNPVRAVFFDWDGTLVDSFSMLEQAHDHVRSSYGMEENAPGWFRHYFGQQRDYIYRSVYGPENAEEARTRFEAFFIKHHCDLIRPLDGAADLLEALAARGITMGIVSNKKGLFVRREIEHLGWNHYFATIVGAGEAEQDKPAAAPLRLALGQAGFTREAEGTGTDGIWYAGDSRADQDCARQAGIDFVFLETGERADDLETRPLHVVKDCPALQEFFIALR